ITADNSSMYLGLPLSLRLNKSFGIVGLYARLGIEPVYLLYSTTSLERTDNTIGAEIIPGSVNVKNTHLSFDVRPFGAVGLEFDIGRDVLTFSAGYKASLFTQLDQDMYYSDPSIQSKFRYIEDNLYLNHAFISLSYIRPIYNPKKILE
ncbi:hypothetical protein ACFLT1_09030, partial [Bacteroidota bacterium]